MLPNGMKNFQVFEDDKTLTSWALFFAMPFKT